MRRNKKIDIQIGDMVIANFHVWRYYLLVKGYSEKYNSYEGMLINVKGPTASPIDWEKTYILFPKEYGFSWFKAEDVADA